jgi:hypothetical protein
MRTPGINPWSASLRKQIRQIPNFRYTARGRPHSRQRHLRRVVNFGVCFILANLLLLATEEFLAMCFYRQQNNSNHKVHKDHEVMQKSFDPAA